MLGRGKVLIMSDSAYTRTFVWNVSVWRSMYHICTLYIFTAWSVIAVLLSVNYQQEKLKINNFWFPSTWWFPSFLGFFSKCWPGKEKNVIRYTVFGCLNHGQDLVTKCATSVSLWGLEKWTTHSGCVIGSEWPLSLLHSTYMYYMYM